MTRGLARDRTDRLRAPGRAPGRLPADRQEPRGDAPAAAVRPLLPDGAGRSARILRAAQDPCRRGRWARSSSRTRGIRSARGRPSSPSPAPIDRVVTRSGPLLRTAVAISPIPTRWSMASRTIGRDHDDQAHRRAPRPRSTCPAHGEGTVVVLLGQADDRERAEAAIRKYRDPDAALAGLEETRRWWSGLMDTLRVQTSEPGVRPLPGLAEVPGARRTHLGAARVLPGQRGLRIPRPAPGLGEPDLDGPRRGPPADPPARLPAVHRRGRRRTGSIASRTGGPASSGGPTPRTTSSGCPGPWSSMSRRPATSPCSRSVRPTWRRSSRSSRCPPGSTGWGSTPSARLASDTVYRHCLKAIDLVLEKRMGAHGLPLMGTGDWNDGLDEIGSQGRGESVWLGFFLHYILERMIGLVGEREGAAGGNTTSAGWRP